MDRPRTRSMYSKQYSCPELDIGMNTVPPSTPPSSQQLGQSTSNPVRTIEPTHPSSAPAIRFPSKLNFIGKRSKHKNSHMPPPDLPSTPGHLHPFSVPVLVDKESGNRTGETPIKMPAGDFSVPGREVHDAIDPVVWRQIVNAQMVDLDSLDRQKFPDECFPFDIHDCTEKILCPKGNKKKLYQNGIWANYPDANTPQSERESKVCAIFNSIGESIMMARGLGKKLVRRWTSRFASSPVPHERCTRKPDITLMNTAYISNPKDQVNWRHALGETELKIGATVKKEDNKMQLAQTARLIFGAQPDRRFVLGLSLVNSEMSLMTFNRGCLMVSDTFDIHLQPERLVRIVAGFMFADRTYLGFDKGMELTEVDGRCCRTVTVNSNIYDIREVLHVEDVIRGRATLCLKVTRGGRTYVVKNAWVDKTRQMKEPEILKKLEGIGNVTQMVEYECIKLDDENEDVTTFDVEQLRKRGWLTQEQEDKIRKLDVRQQVRVVLTPFGRALRNFKTIRELFRAFIDVVEVIEKLHEKSILHRDISLRNILIVDEEGENREGRGLLIDFDYAIWLMLNGVPATLHRTGTLPFMAIDVLMGRGAHRYDHDLESVFYVMCYLFCTSAGPYGFLRDDFDLRASVFGRWFGTDEQFMVDIALTKMGTVTSHWSFDLLLASRLSPYFNTAAVKNCLHQLRLLLFKEPMNEEQFKRYYSKDDVDKSDMIYDTPREKRDPKEFFNVFKSILQDAYESTDKETPVPPHLSTHSQTGISALARAERELPWRPIDKEDALRYGTSRNDNPAQVGNAFPSDSGVIMDTVSNPRKRRVSSDDGDARSASVVRPWASSHKGGIAHKSSGSGRMDTETTDGQSMAIEDGYLETSAEDSTQRREGKRRRIHTRVPEHVASSIPFPAHGQCNEGAVGERSGEPSSRRVTRSSAKTMAAGIVGSKAPVKTLRRSTHGRESGTSHKYPTRSKTRSQGTRAASIVQPEQQIIGVRIRTRSQVVNETGLFKARSTPDLRK